jgi:cell division septation protein DedD
VVRGLHPPEARVTDTASVPLASFAITTAIGDRIYFATDSGLAGVRVRDLARTRSIGLPGPASAAAATPSGDRIFVALAGEPTIAIVDRYEEKVVAAVAVGHPIASLRMDPDGRYLLAERDGQDSVAVISVAEARVIRTVRTRWRADLPLVAPDGALLMLDSTDAVDIRPTDGKVRRRYAGGARELWALIRWDGFRPRAKVLDVPVNFDADSTDSTGVAPADTAGAAPAAAPVAAPAPREEAKPEPAHKSVAWTLSFAALLDEQRAKALALTIRVDNKPVHVVKGTRDGVAIWRVVYGPFATRDEAERAGRKTGLPFWVYEDAP